MLLIAFAAALALVTTLHMPDAAAQLAKKGEAGEQWEISMKMEMAGMPGGMPPMSHRMCLSKQAGDDKYIPRQENCKVTDVRRSGNTQQFKMTCTGRDPMTVEGEVTLAGATFSGKTRMSGKVEGQSVEIAQTFSGKKLGDCTG
ncbi:MAG TPA: DUF3617 family protein [Casimicrobiaceae bacterium]|nr:DUF3617 family protein [Casimicrobiaceae bacterium]